MSNHHTDAEHGYSVDHDRDGEPTYTLAEARLELMRREHALYGHDWTIHSTIQRGPHALTCPCGKHCTITED